MKSNYRAGLLLACLSLLFLTGSRCGAEIFTNVTEVNVSPREFGVFFRALSNATFGIEVYADDAGVTSLDGQVSVEWQPIKTGWPAATTEYDRRLDQRALAGAMLDRDLYLVRIGDCVPDTHYYYRLRAYQGAVPIAQWPAGLPLPEVHTEHENRFIKQARQLLVSIPGNQVTGYAGLVTHTNACYPLCAVSGDGCATNQLYFNLANLFDCADHMNLDLDAAESVTLDVFGPLLRGMTTRDYAMDCSNSVQAVSADALISDGTYLMLALGSTNIMATNLNGYVDLEMLCGVDALEVSFNLGIDEGKITNLSMQAVSASVQTAQLTRVSDDLYEVTLTPVSGTLMHGTLDPETMARLQFEPTPGTRTGLSPLDIRTVVASRQAGGSVNNGFLYDGSVIVVDTNSYVAFGIGTGISTLRVYGRPDVDYTVQYRTNLMAGAWQDAGLGLFSVSLPDCATTVDISSLTNHPTLFLRISETNP